MNTANSKRLFHFEARSHFLEIEIERFSSSLAIFKSHLLSSLYGLLRLAIVRPDRSNWSICSDASPFQTDLLSIMCSVFSTRAFHIWKRLIENLFHSVSHSHFSFLLSLLVLSDGATRLAIQKIGVSHRCLFVILFLFFFLHSASNTSLSSCLNSKHELWLQSANTFFFLMLLTAELNFNPSRHISVR